MPTTRSVKELLEDAQTFLDAAQRACNELKRSPLTRLGEADHSLMDAELCADVIEGNCVRLINFCIQRSKLSLRKPRSNGHRWISMTAFKTA